MNPRTDPEALPAGERERRWAIADELMREHGVDALVVFADHSGAFGSSSPAAFFTNEDAVAAVVVMPRVGEPFVFSARRPTHFLVEEDRGFDPWIRDWRFARAPEAFASALEERELACSRIGTIGAVAGSHFVAHGHVAYGFWSRVLELLPHAEFVELYRAFVPRWLVKTDAELVHFRRAAAIAEIACRRMLEVTGPGVSEIELYAAAQSEILRQGGQTTGMILQTGTDNVAWGKPNWLGRVEAPRILRDGDVVLSELFPTFGRQHAQAQMCIGVGQVHDDFCGAAVIARECYEIGLARLRPGVRFDDVAQAMDEPLRRENAWRLTPMIHSLNPLELVGPGSRDLTAAPGLEERFGTIWERTSSSGGDVVVQEGMEFQLEPNVCFGRRRVNIGGNVIVTRDGCEELNALPCRMNHV